MAAALTSLHRLWRLLPPRGRRRALLRAATLLAPRPDRVPPPVREGVIVVGELGRASGLGEGARLVLAGLAALGVPAWTDAREAPPGAALLLYANAPQVPLALARLGRRAVRGRRVIGFWNWELPVADPDWRIAAPFVHEVWVPSQFTAAALEPLAPGRVRVVSYPLALRPPVPSLLSRAAFGLPERAVVTLAVMSLASSFVRKNPLAVVAAHRAAFGERADRILVLKVTDPDHFPDDFARLRAACAGMANIQIEARTLPRADLHALMAASDIVLSLHRSEGFGLVPAEAMLLGRAVVATDWSATAEFLHDGVAAPVPARMVPVGDPRGVYAVPGAEWAEPDVEAAAAWLRASRGRPGAARGDGGAGTDSGAGPVRPGSNRGGGAGIGTARPRRRGGRCRVKVLVWQWGRRGAGPRVAVELARGLGGVAGVEAALSLSANAEILQGPGAPRCDLPVPTYGTAVGFAGRMLTAPLLVPGLARQVRALAPDVALCAMPAPLDLLMAAALRRAGVPFLVVVHDADAHPGDGLPLQMPLQRALLRRANGLVALSAHVAARLQAQGAVRGRMLLRATLPPLGFGPAPPALAHGGKLRLLSFGRLLPYKGLDLLAAALASLGERPDLQVRVVGSGPESAALAQLRASPGVVVENRWVPEGEVGDLLAWADALVLSHREASQSGVAAAAIAARRWVVATRVGGLAEQLADENLAILCEPTATGVMGGLLRLLAVAREPPGEADPGLAWRRTVERLAGEMESFVRVRA